MEEPATSVRSGEIITSALMNQVLERLDDLESETAFIMGSIGMDAHTVVAIGSGFENAGGIWLDGQLLSGEPARGINLLILDSSLHIKFQGTYNTADDPRNSVQLADDLQTRTAAGDLVVVVTHEIYAPHLEENGKAVLAAMGGAAMAHVADPHAAAAFIGVVPAGPSGVSFDYLVSVLPMDASAQIVGAPVAWGLYSSRLQTFLAGQAGNTSAPVTPMAPAESPPAGIPGVTISAVALQQETMATSTRISGTLMLTGPAPSGGLTAMLSSSNPQVATVQGSVSIPAGQISASFSVTAIAPGNAAIIVSIPAVAPQSVSVAVVQALAVSSIAFTPAMGAPNSTVTGTVALNDPAPAGGAIVNLISDNPEVAMVQGSISIPQGQQSGTFPVTTPGAGTATIGASLPGGQPQTAALTVTPALAIDSLVLNPNSVESGGRVTGTLTLTGPASNGGATIVLSTSNSQVAGVQPSITIVPGGSSAPFTVTAGTAGTAIITATLAGSPPQTAELTVAAPLALTSFALTPSTAASGTQISGAAALNGPAPPAGTTLTLLSSDPQIVAVPAGVTIVGGQSDVTFSVTALGPGTETVSASLPGGTPLTATLTVTPALVLSSLTLNPTTVAPAGISSGTVTLNGPAPDGGLSVALASNNSQVATVPSSVVVPPGQTSVPFQVTASAVGTAVIIASFPGSSSQSDTLTVRVPKGGKDGKEAVKEAKDSREHKHVAEIPPVRGPVQPRGGLDASQHQPIHRPAMSRTGETDARRHG